MSSLQQERLGRLRRLVFIGLVALGSTALAACGDDDDDDTTSASDDSGTGGDASASGTGGSSSSDTTGGDDSGDSTASADECEQGSTAAAHVVEVVSAAEAFLAALTSEQQSEAQYELSIDNAAVWSNLPVGSVTRNGVRFADMDASAQAAALALAELVGGEVGYTLFEELRLADGYLVTDGGSGYGSGLYYFAVLGTPASDSTWILQIGGHHMAYNFTYAGPCTSATPLFDGVEPTNWTDDDGAEHAALEAQRSAMADLTAAISGMDGAELDGTFSDLVNGPTSNGGGGGPGASGDSMDTSDTNAELTLTYPTGSEGRGVNVSTLSEDEQELVKTAIEAWVMNVADPISSVLLEAYESEEAFEDTYVGYSGSVDLTTNASYVRVDGPRVWIEFSVQSGIIYPEVHYHTIWRDKVADYGAEFASD